MPIFTIPQWNTYELNWYWREARRKPVTYHPLPATKFSISPKYLCEAFVFNTVHSYFIRDKSHNTHTHTHTPAKLPPLLLSQLHDSFLSINIVFFSLIAAQKFTITSSSSEKVCGGGDGGGHTDTTDIFFWTLCSSRFHCNSFRLPPIWSQRQKKNASNQQQQQQQKSSSTKNACMLCTYNIE